MNAGQKLLLFIALFTAAFAGVFWFQSWSQPRVILMNVLAGKKNLIPIAIIGSGPGGVNAALYGARAGIHTVVFKGKTAGGQLTTTTYVENWPGIPKMLGPKLMETNIEQAQKFGALMVSDIVTEVDFSQWPYKLTTDEGHTVHALTVILATGSNPRLLNDTGTVPGEKEYWGYGVTSCAVCDAPFYKDKEVVVIGGGDSAVEEATLLTSYAKKVTVLVRGSQLRAAAAMQSRLKDYPKISILFNTKVTEILGDGSVVTGVRLFNKQAQKSSELKTDGVFLAIGHTPNSQLVKKWIALDGNGYIRLNSRSQHTNIPGIFAAGDIADNVYRQAGVAAGNGIKAGLDAIEFLQKHGFSTKVAQAHEKRFYDPDQEEGLSPLPKFVTSYDVDMAASKHPWVVIEVGAEACASCKTLEPIVRSVAKKLSDKAFFAMINLDDEPKELIKRFKLKAVPTILILKKGKLIARYDQQLFSVRELYSVLNVLMSEK